MQFGCSCQTKGFIFLVCWGVHHQYMQLGSIWDWCRCQTVPGSPSEKHQGKNCSSDLVGDFEHVSFFDFVSIPLRDDYAPRCIWFWSAGIFSTKEIIKEKPVRTHRFKMFQSYIARQLGQLGAIPARWMARIQHPHFGLERLGFLGEPGLAGDDDVPHFKWRATGNNTAKTCSRLTTVIRFRSATLFFRTQLTFL